MNSCLFFDLIRISKMASADEKNEHILSPTQLLKNGIKTNSARYIYNTHTFLVARLWRARCLALSEQLSPNDDTLVYNDSLSQPLLGKDPCIAVIS